MIYGKHRDQGWGRIELDGVEVGELEARRPVSKITESAKGVFRLTVKMTKLRRKPT